MTSDSAKGLPDKLEIDGHSYIRTEHTEDIIKLDYLESRNNLHLFVRNTQLDPPLMVYVLNRYGEGVEYFIDETDEEDDDFDISQLREMITIRVDEHPHAADVLMRYFSGNPKPEIESSGGLGIPGTYEIRPGKVYRICDLSPDETTVRILIDQNDEGNPAAFTEEEFASIEPITTKRWKIYLFDYERELFISIFPNFNK